MSGSSTLVWGESEREHGKERVDSEVKKDRFQGGEGGKGELS